MASAIPAAVVGKDAVSSRRPEVETAVNTCTSRWVSVPHNAFLVG